VRKRGKEIMVEVADIDWIGGRQLRRAPCRRRHLRSVAHQARGELDPRRSSESITVRGQRRPDRSDPDQRRLAHPPQDGAEVNLSRRYRQRFEALVPVQATGRPPAAGRPTPMPVVTISI
jgi:hypothetical protein